MALASSFPMRASRRSSRPPDADLILDTGGDHIDVFNADLVKVSELARDALIEPRSPRPPHQCRRPCLVTGRLDDWLRGYGGIYVMDANGTHLRLLSSDVHDVVWSPDSSTIATSGSPSGGGVILVDVTTGAQRFVAPFPDPEGNGGSWSWSPDGRSIVVFQAGQQPEVVDVETGRDHGAPVGDALGDWALAGVGSTLVELGRSELAARARRLARSDREVARGQAATWLARRSPILNNTVRLVLAAAAVVVVALVVYQVLVVPTAGGPAPAPAISAQPSVTAADRMPPAGPLLPGERYTVVTNGTTLTFAVPVAGWDSDGSLVGGPPGFAGRDVPFVQPKQRHPRRLHARAPAGDLGNLKTPSPVRRRPIRLNRAPISYLNHRTSPWTGAPRNSWRSRCPRTWDVRIPNIGWPMTRRVRSRMLVSRMAWSTMRFWIVDLRPRLAILAESRHSDASPDLEQEIQQDRRLDPDRVAGDSTLGDPAVAEVGVRSRPSLLEGCSRLRAERITSERSRRLATRGATALRPRSLEG